MRLLLTRPREDSEPLAERLRGRGHAVIEAPLLEIRPLPDVALDLDGVQALLLTSANGARALPASDAVRALPAFVVGAATAKAAHEAGLTAVTSAEGDVTALAQLVIDRLDPADGALMHIAASRVAGDLAGRLGRAGFAVRRAVIYEAVTAQALPPAARAALDGDDVDAVLLYSPRTAATFAALVGEAGLAETCRGIDALCLSRAVADAVGALPWHRVRIAPRPEQQALLALLERAKDGA